MTKKKIRQIYGIYAFDSKDFARPPLVGISRTLKATKHDASILIEYE